MANVTLLGTGAMGSRMARRLIDAKHAVTVWNRTREKIAPLVAAGAVAAQTAAEAVKDSELVIAMLRDDKASREVWLDSGALDAMPKNAVAIESSTVTVAWIRQLAEECAKRGIAFLDAPVAGSLPQAEAGQLIFLAGGDDGIVERVSPILRTMGSAVQHAGGTGAGAAVKLVINAMLGVQVAALAEVLALAQPAGVDASRAFEIFSATSVCSPAMKAYGGGMIARNFAPMFPVELAEKDLGYVVGTAAEARSSVPLSEAAHEVFARAAERGFGAENMNAVIRLYE